MDFRHSPRLCELPPRVTRAPSRANVSPLPLYRQASKAGSFWRASLLGWVFAALVLAAVLW
jgi:hypothetical protein